MPAASLGISGALLGAAAFLPARRSLTLTHRRAGIGLAGVAGALLLGRGVERLLGAPAGTLASAGALIFVGLLASIAVAIVLDRAGVLEDGATIPGVAALVLAALGLVPMANVLTGGHSVPWFAQASRYWILVGGPLLLVLLAAARWMPVALDRLRGAAARAVLRVPGGAFVGAAAIFAFIASAVFASLCFGRQPHNADEVAQLWQAKILLSGRLALPLDPNPEFFGVDNMIEQGRWYSQFPVGGPAFLALGVAAGAAWLLGPLLIGLTVIAVYQFARRAYGEPVGRAAALLFALTPFALFVGASFMNHVPTLWLATVAMAQLAVWMDEDRPRTLGRAAAIVGLALGAAFTIRPLDAVVVAAVIGAMQLAHLRGRPAHLRSLAYQLVAGLVPVAVLLYVNARTTGAPFRFGYAVLYGDAHQLGFHVDPYGGVHTPARALAFASKYLLQLDEMLFQWPLPALGVIVAGLLALRRPSRWDRFLIALLAAQLLSYALYWHEGDFRGPRFLFTVLGPIVILAARAPFVIAGASRGAIGRAAHFVIPACVLVAWLAVGYPPDIPSRVGAYRRAFAPTRVDPDALARRAGLRHAVVFVNESWESRNVRHLWALGIGRGDALRLAMTAPPCAVEQAIREEQQLTPARTAGRLNRIVRRATSIAPDAPPPPFCAEEMRRDSDGYASYAPFFPANGIDEHGRVDGDVIYVLDLGDRHNEALRSRFGDREWYRFGPHLSRGEAVATLTPYHASGVSSAAAAFRGDPAPPRSSSVQR